MTLTINVERVAMSEGEYSLFILETIRIKEFLYKD